MNVQFLLSRTTLTKDWSLLRFKIDRIILLFFSTVFMLNTIRNSLIKSEIIVYIQSGLRKHWLDLSTLRMHPFPFLSPLSPDKTEGLTGCIYRECLNCLVNTGNKPCLPPTTMDAGCILCSSDLCC